MIKRGTLYEIVGVHEVDARFEYRKAMYGTIIESIDLKRWPKNSGVGSGWYNGLAKQLTGYNSPFPKDTAAGTIFKSFAIYLHRVKEEAKP